jgi:hypothetical protein
MRKVVSIVSNLLPGPPPDEGAPPDVDGRRPTDADLTKIDVEIQSKHGKGGYR